jgi:adenylate cyclase class 2
MILPVYINRTALLKIMSSLIEVEIKIPIDRPEGISEKLKEKGGILIGLSNQEDTYLNAPHRDYAQTDEALRIRSTSTGAEITYKGEKMKGMGAKAREEINIPIVDTAQFIRLFSALGFTPSAQVNKIREEWTYKGTTVSLDTVTGLGTFVEIEVIAQRDECSSALERIELVKKDLGIEGDHIRESYLELLLATTG